MTPKTSIVKWYINGTKYIVDEEKDLNDTVIFYARHGFPFTDLKLRKLAYELAVANKRKGFSPVKKMAGPW